MNATAVDAANSEQHIRVRARPSAGRTDVLLRAQIVFLLALSAVMLLAIIRLGSQVAGPNEPPKIQAPGIVWGGRTFVDLHAFAQWLHARGYSYEVWAQNHRPRAGLPPLATQTKPVDQRGAPGWLKRAVGLAAIAFTICCVVILRRRRFSWRAGHRETAHASLSERVRFEASWWTAALQELRRLVRRMATGVAQLVRSVGGYVSSEHGSLRAFHIDWRSVKARGLYTLRVVGRRANPSTGDAFWYGAATFLAIAMSVAITRWG